MRRGIVTLTGILFSCFLFGQSYDDLVKQYIDQYKSVAIEEMHRTGVPASLSLAQGIIESNAGTAPLATKANNHFGIKCHEDWTGKTFYEDDDTKDECFRKYASAGDSYRDHSDFLRTHSRYANLFKLNPADFEGWANGLKEDGYATNPSYPRLLIKAINTYQLFQFDMNAEEWAKWESDHPDTTNQIVPAVIVKNIPVTIPNSEQVVFEFNNIKSVIVQPGETIDQVADKYEIGLPRLSRYNDLTGDAVVSAGDRIYLQPKRRNGDVKFHLVQEGETMWFISQSHGIQLQKLYEKNKMEPGSEPAAGETIYLKSGRDFPPKLKSKPEENAVVQTIIPTPVIAVDSADLGVKSQFYTVKSGDTLYSIARHFNTTVSALQQKNNLQDSNLYIGMKLSVPQ